MRELFSLRTTFVSVRKTLKIQCRPGHLRRKGSPAPGIPCSHEIELFGVSESFQSFNFSLSRIQPPLPVQHCLTLQKLSCHSDKEAAATQWSTWFLWFLFRSFSSRSVTCQIWSCFALCSSIWARIASESLVYREMKSPRASLSFCDCEKCRELTILSRRSLCCFILLRIALKVTS